MVITLYNYTHNVYRRDEVSCGQKRIEEQSKSSIIRPLSHGLFGESRYFFAGGRGGGNGGRDDSGRGTGVISNPFTGEILIKNDTIASVISFVVPLALGVFILIVSMRIFLGYPLEVGGRRFFIKCSRYEDHRGCFRFAFHSDHYIRIVAAMLVRSVLVFLWSLLLIIPGIVMSYAYSMVPYLMAENPGMGYRRALELSKAMTWGHKLDMFVLDHILYRVVPAGCAGYWSRYLFRFSVRICDESRAVSGAEAGSPEEGFVRHR
jgi:hypothetical protein